MGGDAPGEAVTDHLPFSASPIRRAAAPARSGTKVSAGPTGGPTRNLWDPKTTEPLPTSTITYNETTAAPGLVEARRAYPPTDQSLPGQNDRTLAHLSRDVYGFQNFA